MEPLTWGILGVAKIATEKVIPAMQKSRLCRVAAIASRQEGRAKEAAARLGIEKAYGSYEALLADPSIEAIYNPLPNHLHVPWSIKAAEAGKHVLCEKPIALSAAEAETLLRARDATGKVIAEAFMVRHHPQWLRARQLVREGRIGELRAVQGTFSYHLLDPANVRNIADIGGGGIYDIGVYPTVTSRFLFEAEPVRVAALVERDPAMGIDRLASALLDFPAGQASFLCSTQLVPYQRMQIFGTKGRIEVEIPFNAPPAVPVRIFIDDGSKLGGGAAVTESFGPVDQYTEQADAFVRSVRTGTPLGFPLEDSVKNMRIVDALFRAGETGMWVEV